MMQTKSDRERIAELERQVAALRSRLDADEAADLHSLRRLSSAAAKKEIKALFERHHGETLYPSDIAVELRLDYDFVVKVLEAMVGEGQIGQA